MSEVVRFESDNLEQTTDNSHEIGRKILSELDEEWGNLEGLDIEERENFLKKVLQAYELLGEQEVFEQVDMMKVRATIDKHMQGITCDRLRKIGEEYMSGSREWEDADREMLEYMAQVLELEDVPEITYYDGEEQDLSGFCRKGEIHLSKDSRQVKTRVQLIAHESFHIFQEQHEQDNEYYKYNFRHYVPAGKDEEKYKNQLVEREAYIYGCAVSWMYDYSTSTNRVIDSRAEDRLRKQAVEDSIKVCGYN